MPGTNEFRVVEFAATKDEQPKTLLITEAQDDRWCDCEPQEGYGRFEHSTPAFEIDDVSLEALIMLLRLHCCELTPAEREKVFTGVVEGAQAELAKYDNLPGD